MTPSKINFADKFSKLPDEDYSMRIVAKMNNYEFKIVKFKGEFVWHSHPDTDETFIILKGKMLMHLRDKVVELTDGEMIVILKGVEHKPASEEGYVFSPIKMTCSPKSWAGFREQARISSIWRCLADLGTAGNQYLSQLFQRAQR